MVVAHARARRERRHLDEDADKADALHALLEVGVGRIVVDSGDELDRLFDPQHAIRNLHVVFDRLEKVPVDEPASTSGDEPERRDG